MLVDSLLLLANYLRLLADIQTQRLADNLLMLGDNLRILDGSLLEILMDS